VKGIYAAGIGGVVGGVLAYAMAKRKEARLRRRGLQLMNSLTHAGGELEAYLALRGDEVRADVEEVARLKADPLARQTAHAHLRDVYGVTPGAIETMQRLVVAGDTLNRYLGSYTP